jgi:hypothetical protein
MNKIKKLFVCIGAQKSATSWLHGVLSNDSQFRMPHFIKEVHYFSWVAQNDKLINKWRQRWKSKIENDRDLPIFLDLATKDLNNQWYVEFMKLEPSHTWAVDITPDYAAMNLDGFNCIKDVADAFKLLFILRDPVDRSWSAIIHWFKNQRSIQNLMNKSHSDLITFAKSNVINCRSNYLKTLSTLIDAKIFHLNKILFYDQLLVNSAGFIKEIYDHLELDFPSFEEEVLQKKTHVSPKISLPEEFNYEMTNFYKPMIRELNSVVEVPDNWKIKYDI